MRKGELSRARIVDTAEKMFWEKGYEETSVQDILDELNMSKGGFYHHFTSKEELLGEVSEKRLRDRIAEETKLLDALSVKDALNRILVLLDPFEREEKRYAAMLAQACIFGRDVNLRERQRELITELLTEPMEKVILRGVKEDFFCVRRVKESAKLVLLLEQDAVEEVMRLMRKGGDEAINDACLMMDESRHALEKLLTAPYGTCRPMDADRLKDVMRLLEDR